MMLHTFKMYISTPTLKQWKWLNGGESCWSRTVLSREFLHVRKMIATFFKYSVFAFQQYAQETQHEKILRGLAVGIALTMFNRLEESDALVTSLSTDKDPVLRRSGMYTIAMAYCGTGNNQAIRKLLHVAVSISLNQKSSFLEYPSPDFPLTLSFNRRSVSKLVARMKKNAIHFIHTRNVFFFFSSSYQLNEKGFRRERRCKKSRCNWNRILII